MFFSRSSDTVPELEEWPPSGFLGNISPEQQIALDDFRFSLKEYDNMLESTKEDEAKYDPFIRSEIAKILQDDMALLRLLRARKFEPKHALTLMLQVINWRVDTEPDKILEETVREFIQKQLLEVTGFDKRGRPVGIIRVRRHDKYNRNLDKMQLFCVYIVEKCINEKLPNTIDNITVIFDLRDFGWSNCDYELVKFIITLFEKYYPERLGICLVVNAPWIFSTVWTVVKPWLDPRTAQKVHILYEHDELLQYVEDEQITYEIKSTDP